MPFNPDDYLKKKSGGFNPDAYLQVKQSQDLAKKQASSNSFAPAEKMDKQALESGQPTAGQDFISKVRGVVDPIAAYGSAFHKGVESYLPQRQVKPENQESVAQSEAQGKQLESEHPMASLLGTASGKLYPSVVSQGLVPSAASSIGKIATTGGIESLLGAAEADSGDKINHGLVRGAIGAGLTGTAIGAPVVARKVPSYIYNKMVPEPVRNLISAFGSKVGKSSSESPALPSGARELPTPKDANIELGTQVPFIPSSARRAPETVAEALAPIGKPANLPTTGYKGDPGNLPIGELMDPTMQSRLPGLADMLKRSRVK